MAGELMAGMLMSAGEDGTIKWWDVMCIYVYLCIYNVYSCIYNVYLCIYNV